MAIFDMGSWRKRAGRVWLDWNFENTPGIFFVVTIFGAFVFSGIIAAFSALAWATWGYPDSDPSGALFAPVVCGPPLGILVVWLAYRVRMFRRLFGPPSEAVHTPQ